MACPAVTPVPAATYVLQPAGAILLVADGVDGRILILRVVRSAPMMTMRPHRRICNRHW
jgi:hypothetical protein